MIFYWASLILCLGGYCYTIWSLSKKYGGPTFQEQRVWMKKKTILIYIGGILVICLTLLIFKNQLSKTIWCAYKGHEHSVSTRYNWISGVCSYEGPNNTWIPITRLIGFPEGEKEKEVNNVQSDTNTH